MIFYVIYTSHIMACLWLKIGMMEECATEEGACTKSWVYEEGFDQKPYHTQYIFAFYWIFEVITTVGYGDYVGAT